VGLRDQGQRWELSLWSQNLFDHSTNGVGTLSYVGGLPGGYRGVDTPQKRRVGVTLRYDFGM
jgi:iron complex outermembrane receptor protein